MNCAQTGTRKIQMVDLQTQYQRIKKEIDAGIEEVINSAAFIKGPKVAEFQAHLEQYTGAKHVINVGNGTDALQIALMGLGLQPGDEVITPTFTFIATAEVVALLGLTPVVVDVDWNTMNMDIESVRRAITPKTKAIVPVHNTPSPMARPNRQERSVTSVAPVSSPPRTLAATETAAPSSPTTMHWMHGCGQSLTTAWWFVITTT